MRIAVYYNLPPGGAKRILFEQVKLLSKKHEIDVYTLSTFEDDFLSLKKYSKNYYLYKFKLNSKLPVFLSRLEKDYKNFFELKRLNRKIAEDIDSRKYDVAFIHTDVFTEAPFLLRFLKTPKAYFCEELLRIVYERNLDIDKDLFILNKLYERLTRKIRKQIDRKNAISADLIMTTSNFMKSKIARAYGKNAIVCYPGVDTNNFKKIIIDKENKLLFLGNKEKIDGYNLILSALKRIPKDIRPKLHVLEFSKKGPKIQNDKKLAKEYSSSFLTLCLDYEEPFGLKVLESLACGTPVIAVNDGGYKETLINNKTGYLIKRNPKELSEKIIHLLKDKNKYNCFSRNGIKYVKDVWNWDKGINVIVEELIKLLEKDRKILISELDSGGLGGSETFLTYLLISLKRKGNSVGFLASKYSKFKTALIKEKYIFDLVPFRMDILGHFKGLLKFIFLFPLSFVINYKNLSKLKIEGYSGILIPGFSDKITLSFAAKLLGIKCVWIEYAPLDEAFKRNFGIPKLFYLLSTRFCDKYIIPTQYTKSRILKIIPSLKNKIEIIPCGLEILTLETINSYKKYRREVRKELGVKKNEKVLGLISRIELGKGQDTLIKAAKLLKNKFDNLKIIIIGEGDTDPLIKLIKNENLSDDVILLGFKKDIYKYLASFDIFVFPTRWKWEGFGLVNLEAMLFGLPVITSNTGPVPEVIKDAAILIEPNEKELARSVERLLDNRNLMKKLSKNGYLFVKNNYDINIIAEKYLKVFRNI